MVLPEGFALPPVPYLLALVVALGGVALGLYCRGVDFDGTYVLALVPWMVTGSALHVLYVLEAVPSPLTPLFGTPAVYATVAAVAGSVWLGATVGGRSPPRVLAASGITGGSITVLGVGAVGVASGTLRLFPSTVAIVVAIAVTAVAWMGLTRLRPSVTDVGRVGVTAVGAHALDGVSTAVGVDWLGFGERTPLSSAIIEFGASLPTAELLGGAWLFVLVKVVIVAWIVTAFVDYVREEPAEGYALLGVVTAVGLGPAVHNLLLFAVA
jgi:uncharacterized membrane protein